MRLGFRQNGQGRRSGLSLGYGSAALCAGLAFAAAAQAQTDAAAAVPEVTVTAQFREQGLQSTPVAITAVDGATLRARGQASVLDLANQAPNVVLKPGASPYGPSLQAFIRGVGQTDFNFAFEPGVGLYVDDVYYSTLPGSILDLLDLDRVEVLRGPQGTLAGQNSIGGAIKLYSKKPDGGGGGYLELAGGSDKLAEARAGLNLTLVPDKLFARVSGVAHRRDGYVTRYDYGCAHPGTVPATGVAGDCVIGSQGGKRYAAGRVALRWLASEKLEFNLAGDYTYDNSEVSPFTLLYVGHTPSASPACPGGAGLCPLPPAGRSARLALGSLPLGTAAGSAFVSYSPFGAGLAQDSFTQSPYVAYATYADPNPLSGAPPYALPDKDRVGGWGVSLGAAYRFSDSLSLTSLTAFRRYEGDWAIDQDGTPVGGATVGNHVTHRQFSQELRLNGRLFGAVDYTVGAFYLDQTSHYGGRINFPTVGLDFIENDTIPGSTRAAFANADWGVADRLHLIAGARYTEVEKTFVFGRLGVPGNIAWAGAAPPQVAPLNGLEARFEGDRFDWRAAVQYSWTPRLMTYVQVSTGFKGGGVNPRPFFPVQAQPHQPETLTAYEAGVKSQWFEDRMRLNLAGFWNRYDDILATINSCPFPGFPPAPCGLPVNAGKAEVKGFEAEADIRPTAGMSLDASLSYLDFDYTTLSPAALASGLNLGMTTPFAPRWKASLGAQYAIDLGWWGALTPRLDLAYQGSFNAAAINTPFSRVPAYTVLNGRLGWSPRDGRWALALEVSNLTDKLYYYSLFDNRSLTQTVFGAPAPPRRWMVRVRRSL